VSAACVDDDLSVGQPLRHGVRTERVHHAVVHPGADQDGQPELGQAFPGGILAPSPAGQGGGLRRDAVGWVSACDAVRRVSSRRSADARLIDDDEVTLVSENVEQRRVPVVEGATETGDEDERYTARGPEPTVAEADGAGINVTGCGQVGLER
jgi:hypothetical protein